MHKSSPAELVTATWRGPTALSAKQRSNPLNHELNFILISCAPAGQRGNEKVNIWRGKATSLFSSACEYATRSDGHTRIHRTALHPGDRRARSPGGRLALSKTFYIGLSLALSKLRARRRVGQMTGGKSTADHGS